MSATASRYLVAREAVQQLIAEHGLGPGDRLPTERELASALGIARPTLRRAMALLETAGVVERRQGAGTFVAEPHVRMDVRVLVSFSRGALSAGLVPGARVLLCETVPADRRLARLFALGAGDPVLHVERVRTANDIPIALERSWFADSLVPGLAGEDLERRSIYELLDERYAIRLRRAEQELAAVALDPREAELLGAARGSPAMLIRRRAFDERERPVEYAEDRYLAERARFHSDAFV